MARVVGRPVEGRGRRIQRRRGLREAAEVDVDWSITHEAYTRVLPVHDPTGFFPRLRDTALSQPDHHLYISSSRLFEESLTLPDRPAGYDGLCQIVMRGKLADAARVADAGETFWRGVETWAEAHDLRIEQELDALLEREAAEKEE
jgi:hypothetical protein